MSRNVPGLQTITDAGHSAPLEQPDAAAQALNDFLDETRSRIQYARA